MLGAGSAKVSKAGMPVPGSSACLPRAFCLIGEIKLCTDEKVNKKICAGLKIRDR